MKHIADPFVGYDVPSKKGLDRMNRS